MKVKINQSNYPTWKEINTKAKGPAKLEKLTKLAGNLWWVWNSEAKELFKECDSELWEKVGNNPVLFLERIKIDTLEKIEKDEEFTLAGFQITPFPIPHDSAENVGYCIRYADETFTIMTDVGMVTDCIKDYILRSNYLVLEANYDEEMLRNGKYPKMLQDRIMSGTGHLSNHQAAQVLAECLHPELKYVWLCHLSEENNHPELARKTVEMHLRSFGIIAGKDFQLEVLRRLIPTGPWQL